MNKQLFIKWMLAACLALLAAGPATAQQPMANVTIRFVHKAGAWPIVLQDSAYENAFGEAYQLTKLKYYVSNAALQGAKQQQPPLSVHLVDAAGEDSLLLAVKPGTYNKLVFTLGVDSLYNCSGAQDGALDPLKGMFWSWNSGYVFFKLEGYSAASTADLQRIEHHVGGYLGAHNASASIELELNQPLQIKPASHHVVEVTLDLDKYWKGNNDISIAGNALIMAPGPLALKSAGNFAGMFLVTRVK